jgi:uncharacterized protein (DUF2147 family)
MPVAIQRDARNGAALALVVTMLLAGLAASAPQALAQRGGEGAPSGQAPATDAGPAQAPGASIDPSNPAMTAVGLWRTIDDMSGRPRSLVRISERGKVLVGEIVEVFEASAKEAVCSLCPDDRKDQPIVGLQIIRDLKRFDDRWADGFILNPEDGKIYTLRALPVDEGRKLEVRGYIGMPVLGRTQTWIREQ